MRGAIKDAPDADPALANLTQAQRDNFRAHTHTYWTGRGGDVKARPYQA